MILDPGSQICRSHSLVPIGGHEEPHSSEDMRGIDQSLRAPTSARRHLARRLRN
jgi:hypothetical protein